MFLSRVLRPLLPALLIFSGTTSGCASWCGSGAQRPQAPGAKVEVQVMDSTQTLAAAPVAPAMDEACLTPPAAEADPAACADCAREEKPRVVLGERKLELLERVSFMTASDELDLSRSQALLDEAADLLSANLWVTKVEIQGHTDSRGSHALNMALSQRRAEAVVAYLVSKGVAPARLSAKGYGPTQPLASNDTEEGLSKNRRVEFSILESAPPEGEVEAMNEGPAPGQQPG